MTFPETLAVIGFVFLNLFGFAYSRLGQVPCAPHTQYCERLRNASARCDCVIYEYVKNAPRQFLTRGDLIARNLPLSLLGRWLSEKPYAIPDPPPALAVEPISAVREAAALTGR